MRLARSSFAGVGRLLEERLVRGRLAVVVLLLVGRPVRVVAVAVRRVREEAVVVAVGDAHLVLVVGAGVVGGRHGVGGVW